MRRGGGVTPDGSGEGSLRSAWLRGGGWFVLATAVLVPGAAVVDLTGWPVSLPPTLRSNLVLALGLSCLTIWWAVTVLSVRGRRMAIVAWLGLSAATAGLVGAGALVLGTLGRLPPGLFVWALSALALEAPLWALVLLVWPGSGRRRAGGTLALPVDLTTVVLAGAFLFWDFLYRPVGGMPTMVTARVAWAGWALVLVSLAVAALRGAREGGGAFRFLYASILCSLAGSYLITVVPAWPPRLMLAAAVGALLLRLGAAEALRLDARPRDAAAKVGADAAPDPDLAATRGVPPGRGVTWFGAATGALLVLHQLAAPLEVDGGGLWPAVLSLGSLVLGGLALRKWGPHPGSAPP